MNNFEKEIAAEHTMLHHYYGDRVRQLFLAAAIIMILTLPFFIQMFNGSVPLGATLSIAGILGVVFLAGLTNPRQTWVMALNVISSFAGLAVFEYHAVIAYLMERTQVTTAFFWINQLLAVIFAFALYYSAKTLRGKITKAL